MPSDLLFFGYLGVFGTAAAACFAGVWRLHRIADPEARRGLRALLVTCGAWAACHVGLFLTPSDWGAQVFYLGGLILGFGTVWGWLYFCSAYSGRSLHRSPTVRRLSAGTYAVVALTKATNPLHGFHYTAEQMQRPFAYVAVDHHFLYWGSVLLAYMLAAVGFFMLAELFARTRGNRTQLAGLFVLVGLPIAMNGIGHTTPWLLDLSHEPLGGAAFALSVLFLASGRLGEAARAGRRDEPALILSGNNRIRNYNRRAARLLPVLREGKVGARVQETLPELAGALNGSKGEEGETFGVRREETTQYVRPAEHALPQSDGRLVLLTDVTEQASRLAALSSNMPGVPYEFRAGPGEERFVAFIGDEADALLGLDPDPDGFYERFVRGIPETHRNTFLRSVERAVKRRSHWRQEVPFDRPDGKRIWLLGSAEPEEKEDGVLFRGLLLDITERVEERRRRQQVIRRVTGAIVEVNAEWQLTLVNDRAEALYGRAEEDLLGKTLWEVLPEVKGTRFEEKFRRAMRSRKPTRLEEQLDGQGRWFDVQVYPNTDGGVAFYFDELTEQKEREEKLEDREELLRSITENVSEGIYRSTAEDGILYANSAFVEMLGYEHLDELRAVDPTELYADPAERERLYQKEDEQGGLSGVEVQFRRKDGSTFTGLLSTQKVEAPNGEQMYNDGAVTDITERKRYEETLRNRRRKIEALYETTSGLLRTEDRDAVPERILDVLQDVFDFPHGHVGVVEDETLVPEEIVAEDLSRTPEPGPQSMGEDTVASRAIRAGEIVVVESIEALKNGHNYGSLSALAGIPIGEWGAVVIGAKTGGFESFDLHLLDVLASYAALILDRLEREKTLIEAREEAEEASQLKSAMLANMSHEIRTPLMSMIGSADLLREDLEGENAEMIEQIFQSGQRLRGTLDSVLQLSRLESGAYKLDDDPVYLDAIVREVAQELQVRAYEAGVNLEVADCGGTVQACLDATATRRIVTNLVENAIKFTPEDGRVRVRVRPEDKDTALLDVEDTGVGIEEGARSEIFEAFKQESKGLNREYEGSGLGLSIVHRLTTLMNGTVEVESEKGSGTRFTVRFPR